MSSSLALPLALILAGLFYAVLNPAQTERKPDHQDPPGITSEGRDPSPGTVASGQKEKSSKPAPNAPAEKVHNADDKVRLEARLVSIVFNRKPQLVQDFTPSPNEILNRVVFIKAKGMTALYDATYLAVEKARQGRHPKKALLIISDGEENSSRYSGSELRRLLQEADVQIYSVGGGSLEWMAALTGGRTFPTWDYRQMRDIYTQIAVFLRRQYVIGFYPTDSASAERLHNVRIRVKAPRALGRLNLSYKKSYQSFR